MEGVEYVSTLRGQGMPDKAIAQRLATAGWDERSIAQVLKAAPSPKQLSVVARRGVLPWMSVAAGCIAVFVALGVYFLRPTPVTYSISLPNASSTDPLMHGSWPALQNPQFYAEVKSRFIAEKASFISADLNTMRLTVYYEGKAIKTVPILAKGKVGSWWETPVGLYEIQSKEDNHFSSFGKVYQPWSLAFQGNFFIHGWPYYEGGEPVASTYSGGCIRLSTEDAKAVYDLVAVGTPVLVYDTLEEQDSFSYQFKTPEVQATAYVAADVHSGSVLASKNLAVQLPIASVTKLMTALVTVEYLNLERKIVVPRSALVETVRPRLLTGQEANVHDLLILMLTESSNEAAETLAAALGREYFIKLMNKKASAIGLTRTSFIDPSGLGVGNSSTAEDMFALVKYIYENRRFIFDITSDNLRDDAYGSPVFKGMKNYNNISDIRNAFLGGKVGTTDEARQTYAGVFALKVGTTTRPVAVVVLGSSDSKSSVKDILGYLNNFYVPAP